MKTLFINKFLSRETIYREPLGIMSLASSVDKKHEVFVAEPNYDNLRAKILDIKPEVIGYSVRTGFHTYYLELNRTLKKEFKFISVFGGPHATFFPDMIHNDGVDCICRGEAEEAFLDLLDTLENKGDVTKVKNFYIKRPEGVYRNGCRPLVEDLDTLAFPSRSLFHSYPDMRKSKVRSFMSGRGCPFDCSYCFNAALKDIYKGQKYVRRRSVDNIINEIESARSHCDFEIAIFEDDTLNLDKKWLRDFSNKFKRTGLKLICVGIRPDLTDEETVSLLKDANCVNVGFGIESGDEKIRRSILGRHMSDEQIINCAGLFKRYKIACITENILGIPGTDLKDDLKTLELNLACKPDYGIAHIMQPYPSTKIFEYAVSQGMYKGNFDNLGSFYGTSSLEMSDRYERENLQRLFALVITFPFLYRYIKALVRLRMRFLYNLLHDLHKAYAGIRRIPYKRTVKDYLSLFKRYFLVT